MTYKDLSNIQSLNTIAKLTHSTNKLIKELSNQETAIKQYKDAMLRNTILGIK